MEAEGIDPEACRRFGDRLIGHVRDGTPLDPLTSDRERALLVYALQLTREPEAMSRADVDALRTAGTSRPRRSKSRWPRSSISLAIWLIQLDSGLCTRWTGKAIAGPAAGTGSPRPLSSSPGGPGRQRPGAAPAE